MNISRVVFRRGAAAMSLAAALAGCSGLDAKVAHKPAARKTETERVALTARQKTDVQLAMARALERSGDLKRAGEAYREILSHSPKCGEAVHRLAIVTDRLGQHEEAEGYFKQALKLMPGNADVFCDLGYSYYLQGRWAEAEMNLKQAVSLERKHARAHNNLGLLYAQTNRLAEAFDQFAKAGCTPAEAHLNMAFVMTLREEWGAARDEYQRALEEDPRSALARERLEALDRLVAKFGPEPHTPVSGSDIQLTSGMHAASGAAARPAAETPRPKLPLIPLRNAVKK